MRFHKSLSGAAFALCLLPAAGQSHLPASPGREATQRICGTCHEIEAVIASRRTRIGWEQMTEEMIGRGAEGSAEEMAAVVAYLTEYFGKVNVNTAPAAELEKLLDFSAKEAQAVVVYRERNGKIKNFEDLKKVPGVSTEKLQAKRGLIAFGQ
jgi:competence protein ComEA